MAFPTTTSDGSCRYLWNISDGVHSFGTERMRRHTAHTAFVHQPCHTTTVSVQPSVIVFTFWSYYSGVSFLLFGSSQCPGRGRRLPNSRHQSPPSLEPVTNKFPRNPRRWSASTRVDPLLASAHYVVDHFRYTALRVTPRHAMGLRLMPTRRWAKVPRKIYSI